MKPQAPTRPNSMRIGFNARVLAENQVRGLLRYTVCLLKALSDIRGMELILFCKEPIAAEHIRGLDAQIVRFDAKRETAWNDWSLPKMLQREGIDVFHAPADRGLPLFKVCPMVVTVHDSYERAHWRSLFPTLKGKAWYWKNEIIHYCRADAIITVSDRTRQDLIRLRIAPRNRIQSIHLAADSTFSQIASDEDSTILKSYGLCRPYVLYVGGYDTRKNVSSLVKGFELSSLSDHQLVIAAAQKPPYLENIREWHTLKRFADIRFIQPLPHELPPLYRQSSFFVLPSQWESFGFPLVEAMASGTPVACSRASALPEIAGDAALFFDPSNPESIAEAMNSLGHDPDLRMYLRQKGFQNARRFAWDKTAKETVKVYNSLIDS